MERSKSSVTRASRSDGDLTQEWNTEQIICPSKIWTDMKPYRTLESTFNLPLVAVCRFENLDLKHGKDLHVAQV